MLPKNSDSSEAVSIVQTSERTLRALEELADRLDAITTRGTLGRWLGGADARVAADAARQIRAIPAALVAGMREAFAIGRAYGQREVQLAEIAMETRVLSTVLARQAWGGGDPGNA
jgi:hypothetical protein